ncbi:hypothetical protein PIB30_057601, partial [Stylosanthes scabra]|nr:hypothetical protein [Stylosanthes scabra]
NRRGRGDEVREGTAAAPITVAASSTPQQQQPPPEVSCPCSLQASHQPKTEGDCILPALKLIINYSQQNYEGQGTLSYNNGNPHEAGPDKLVVPIIFRLQDWKGLCTSLAHLIGMIPFLSKPSTIWCALIAGILGPHSSKLSTTMAIEFNSYHDNAYVASRALHIVNGLNSSATFPLLDWFFKHQEKFYNAPTRNLSRASIVEKIVNSAAKVAGSSYHTAIKNGFNDTQSDYQTRVSFKY